MSATEGDPAERRLLQGLIQLAAGFHKLLVMNNPESAVRLLEKGCAKLEPGPIDLAHVVSAVKDCARAIASGRFDRSAIPAIGAAF